MNDPIKVLEEAEKRATEAPWVSDDDPGDESVGVPVAHCIGSGTTPVAFYNSNDLSLNRKNRDLSVLLRNAAPHLLRLVRAYERLNKARKQYEQFFASWAEVELAQDNLNQARAALAEAVEKKP